MKTFSEKINAYNRALDFQEKLPGNIRVMNPFKENKNVIEVSEAFYQKYYNDLNPRFLILGINPGRFGAGLTGIPFTDSVRLKERCGITNYTGPETHELSSVFIYDMIEQYGGEEKFYNKFFINSLSPLGFTTIKETGKEVNCNYYDSKELTEAVRPFIINNMQELINLGFEHSTCVCLGTGKNQQFLNKLNKEYGFFGNIITLEHPRFIMQYRLKKKQEYIEKYIEILNSIS